MDELRPPQLTPESSHSSSEITVQSSAALEIEVATASTTPTANEAPLLQPATLSSEMELVKELVIRESPVISQEQGTLLDGTGPSQALGAVDDVAVERNKYLLVDDNMINVKVSIPFKHAQRVAD